MTTIYTQFLRSLKKHKIYAEYQQLLKKQELDADYLKNSHDINLLWNIVFGPSLIRDNLYHRLPTYRRIRYKYFPGSTYIIVNHEDDEYISKLADYLDSQCLFWASGQIFSSHLDYFNLHHIGGVVIEVMTMRITYNTDSIRGEGFRQVVTLDEFKDLYTKFCKDIESNCEEIIKEFNNYFLTESVVKSVKMQASLT